MSLIGDKGDRAANESPDGRQQHQQNQFGEDDLIDPDDAQLVSATQVL